MNTDASAVAAAGLIWVIVAVAIYVWTALALSAVFRKCGEQGWPAWVPIYNQIVLLRIAGLSPFLLLLYLVPIAGVLAVWVCQIIACHRVNLAFAVGTGMTVLAAVLFPVWASILGFGSARWVGEEPAGPRRTGLAGVQDQHETSLAAPSSFPATGPIPPMPGAESFHGRSTHVAVEDPLFSTDSEAVAPPAPAPGRPTPFAPSSRTAPVEEFAGPITRRSGAPAMPSDAWAPSDDDVDATRHRPAVANEPPADDATPDAADPLAAVPVSAPAATPPVTRVPSAPAPSPEPEPWAPSRSSVSEAEAFADSSGVVSAIAGVPDAGSPRSALSSVSAQNRRSQIPDDAFDETVIARRRRTDWSLVTPFGDPVPIGADVVLLGRRPKPDPAHPGAQIISIDDGTVSKTHARLELRDDVWWVTDLHSTNGVVFATLLGTEVEATPGVAIEAGDRFLLGDAEIRLTRSAE